MARSFNLYYKNGDLWVSLNAVFPFVTGDLLDERLDEATVTFYSATKSFKPLTEFKVEFFKNGIPESASNKEYFILANDNSAEFPSGSGIYRHEVYLIERTKLLEGVLCPSVTFTNALGNDYSKIKNRVYPMITGRLSGLAPSQMQSINIVSPALSSLDLIIPSVEDVGEALVNSYNAVFPPGESSGWGYEDNGSSVSVIGSDGQLLGKDIVTISSNQLTNQSYIAITYTINTWMYATAESIVPNYATTYLGYKVEIVSSAYPVKPYTITDCVVRVLELAEPLMDGEIPRFTFDGVYYSDTNRVYYSQGSQADKYNQIPAPEFSMTQATLREQLKLIGSYIHAEPYLDENNVIRFLDLGSGEHNTRLNEKPYISNTLKTDINGYCTDVRSNVQNLVNSLGYAKGAIIDPGGGLTRSLRCETMYERINSENGFIKTDYPIYSIDKVLCGLLDSNPQDNKIWKYVPKEITPYVFESTEYGANLSSFDGAYPYSKAWAIYYTQGESGIYGLFYQAPDATNQAEYSQFAIANILGAVNGVSPDQVYNDLVGTASAPFDTDSHIPELVFQVTYKPIAPAVISHGKQYYISGETPFTQIYNQGENLVETQYFGESAKGVAARLGNVEQTRTYMLDKIQDVPKAGQLLEDYAISAVNTEYMPNFIKCTVGLSKDYNRISEYVGINSVKRMYEISERQAIGRDVLIKEDIVITGNAFDNDDESVFFARKEAILSAFTGNTYFGRLKFALFYGYKQDQTQIKDYGILLPILSRSFGNTMHFSMKFKDNYSAGDKSEKSTDDNIKGYWQNDVPYTDYYGRVYWGKILLVARILLPDNDTVPYSLPEVPYSGGSGRQIISTNSFENTINGCLEASKYLRIRKDNREVLSFNIEAEFKTTEEDIIIGSELASRCEYLNDIGRSACMLFVSKKPINKFDKYIPDDASAISDKISINGQKKSLAFTMNIADNLNQGYRSWYIAVPREYKTETYTDDNGNVQEYSIPTGGEYLLAGNIIYRESNGELISEGEGDHTRILYFVTKRQERRKYIT